MKKHQTNEKQQRFDAYLDIRLIRQISEETADTIMQIMVLYGDNAGNLALDAVWSLLVAAGYDLDKFR